MNMQSTFAPSEFSEVSASAMGMRWLALHDAAAVVGALAGHVAEATVPEISNFPATIRDLGGWRRDQAEQGIEDLLAVMEPGIAALLAICAGGTNPAPAALALWQEFHAARAALLALIPPLEA